MFAYGDTVVHLTDGGKYVVTGTPPLVKLKSPTTGLWHNAYQYVPCDGRPATTYVREAIAFEAKFGRIPQ
jgi:hypothetical protein